MRGPHLRGRLTGIGVLTGNLTGRFAHAPA